MMNIDPIRSCYESMEQNISILIQHEDDEEEEQYSFAPIAEVEEEDGQILFQERELEEE